MSEYFTFLDRLRESGTINMFGAGQVLETAFDLDKREARKILVAWMDQFGNGFRNRPLLEQFGKEKSNG